MAWTVPEGPSWTLGVEVVRQADGELFLDLRRWRWLANGEMIPARRGLTIRLGPATIVSDAIRCALEFAEAINPPST